MAKRTTRNSDADTYDNPIGLTGAFAPIRTVPKHASSSYDSPLGMTGAFGPVGEPEEWGEGTDKWAGFDWDSPDETSEEIVEDADDAPADDDRPRGRHGAHAKSAEPEEAAVEEETAPTVNTRSAQLEERMRRSKRTRRTLIVIVVMLLALLGAAIWFAFNLFNESQTQSEQQTQAQTHVSHDAISSGAAANDATTVVTKTADVPNLTSLLGLTIDDAVAKLQHGATVTSTRDVDEEGSAIKTSSTVALTDEPSDSKSSTPTVYLGMDKDGKIIQAGYSVSVNSLGFGSLSFVDAVNNEHVIEKTLKEAGISIPDGAVTLPSDKSAYTTYGSDGKTTVKERSTFTGDAEINGEACTWSSVLSYDYTTANLTGNVGDTIRVIYAYITVNVEPEPEGNAPRD